MLTTLICGASNGLWPHGFAVRSHPARIYPRVNAGFSQPSVLNAETLSTPSSTHRNATHPIATHPIATHPITSQHHASHRSTTHPYLLLLLPATTAQYARADSSTTRIRTSSKKIEREPLHATAHNCIEPHSCYMNATYLRSTNNISILPVKIVREFGSRSTAGYCMGLHGTPWEYA